MGNPRISDAEDFGAFMKDLMPEAVELSDEDVAKFTAMTMKTNSVKATSYDVTAGVVSNIYKAIRR